MTSETKPIELETATADIPEFTLQGQTFYGKVVYIYDGDTVHIVFKLDNKLVKFNCRLLGIDTPEIAPKNITDEKLRNQQVTMAYNSRNYLINRVSSQKLTNERMSKNEVKNFLSKSTKLIWIKCYEFDKYGRLLVELFDEPTSTKSFNQDMIDNKYAVGYDGGTKKEFDKDNFN